MLTSITIVTFVQVGEMVQQFYLMLIKTIYPVMCIPLQSCVNISTSGTCSDRKADVQHVSLD